MTDSYEGFQMEELKSLLQLREEMLADLDERIKKAEKSNTVLCKENNCLSKRIAELTDLINQKNEEIRVLQEKKEENGSVEDPDLDNLDMWCELDASTNNVLNPMLSPYKKKLWHQCKEFLEKVNFKEFKEAIFKDLLGQPEAELILLAVYNFIEQIVRDRCELSNVPGRCFITGPSGCGKSETYRVLKNYFNGKNGEEGKIPSLHIIHQDASMLSPSGYHGKDVINLLDGMQASEGLCVAFYTEVDKAMIQKASNNSNFSRGIQAELLSLIEGQEYKFRKEYIDTRQTLFICDGSFSHIRDAKREKASETKVGFTATKDLYDCYDTLTRREIVEEGGAINELIGRFSVLVNYNRLSKEATLEVIEKYKLRIEKELGLKKLVFSESFIKELLKDSNSELGCRQLFSKSYESALRAECAALSTGLSAAETILIISAERKYNIWSADEYYGDFEQYEFNVTGMDVTYSMPKEV